jgi:uncharacterized protein YlzI (FlbEa/FlbD family)
MEEEKSKRTIADVFREKRESYSTEIREAIKLLNNIKNIAEVQVTFLSMRQRVLEENHNLLEHFTQLKKSYREKKGDEWVNASKIGQIKYGPNEKTTIVDGKTAGLKEKLEQVENQINFYSETIRTTDAVLFGIKDRIAAQKLLDGN